MRNYALKRKIHLIPPVRFKNESGGCRYEADDHIWCSFAGDVPIMRFLIYYPTTNVTTTYRLMYNSSNYFDKVFFPLEMYRHFLLFPVEPDIKLYNVKTGRVSGRVHFSRAAGSETCRLNAMTMTLVIRRNLALSICKTGHQMYLEIHKVIFRETKNGDLLLLKALATVVTTVPINVYFQQLFTLVNDVVIFYSPNDDKGHFCAYLYRNQSSWQKETHYFFKAPKSGRIRFPVGHFTKGENLYLFHPLRIQNGFILQTNCGTKDPLICNISSPFFGIFANLILPSYSQNPRFVELFMNANGELVHLAYFSISYNNQYMLQLDTVHMYRNVPVY